MKISRSSHTKNSAVLQNFHSQHISLDYFLVFAALCGSKVVGKYENSVVFHSMSLV